MKRFMRKAASPEECGAHAWPDDGLAARIVLALRRDHTIAVCNGCLARARSDEKKEPADAP